MVFNSTLDAGGSGIFIGSGGAISTVVDSSGPFQNFNLPSINNAGAIAFAADLDAGGVGLFISSGGTLTTIADSNDGFFFFDNPSINNVGSVAFLALHNTGLGIFTGSDPVNDLVIKAGDSLFGSTVTSLAHLRGFNDLGQIAFLADLADGRQVVVRATPMGTQPPAVVPEPSTIVVWSMLGMMFAGICRWRHKS